MELDPEAHERISYVDLSYVSGPLSCVRSVELLKEALEGSAKLHGVRGEGDGIFVDTIEGVVHDGPWAAVALWNHTHG